MPWIEHIDVPESSTDFFGRERRTRTYKVWGVTIDAIRASTRTTLPTNQVVGGGSDGNGTTPLPRIGDYWDKMRLDSYTSAKVGSIILLFGHYSNDFVVTKIDISYRQAQTHIPYAEKVASISFGAFNKVFGWQYKSRAINESRLILSMTVRMDRAVLLRGMSGINNEVGKIHRLNVAPQAGTGVAQDIFAYGVFSVQGVSQLSSNMSEIVYSWMVDKGTLEIGITPSGPVNPAHNNQTQEVEVVAPIQNSKAIVGSDSKEYCRPPFTEIIAVPKLPKVGEREQPGPVFMLLRPFMYNPEGVGSLPGFDYFAFYGGMP